MSAQSPVTILFTDDSEARLPLVAALRQEGFAVEERTSPDQALCPGPPGASLVILDVAQGGAEACRRLKADPAGPAVLLLHPSANGHLVGDADGHLTRPIAAGQLVAQVKTLVRARQAEQALAASQMRLQDILDHAPVVAHVKDLHGRYLVVNRRWETLFHRCRDQVVGKTVHDVFPRELADVLRDNDRKVLETGAPVEFEEVVTHDEGPHTYLSCKFPLRDSAGVVCAVGGISTEITERVRAEQALRDSEALYHSLVDNLPVCIIRKDRASRFTFANRSFCNDVGLPLEQIVGRSDVDLYPPEMAGKYQRDDRQVMESGEVLEDVEEHPSAEGSTTYVKVLKAPLCDSLGQVIGVQGLFWDISDRRRAEEELARTAVEFRIARSIQQKLFPTATPKVAGLDISGATFGFDGPSVQIDIGGASYPAEAIGGDYFDYLALAGGGLGIAVGDVSGHGIGPALLMAEARAYLRACAQAHADVGAILAHLNRLLIDDIEGDRFITLLLARLDPERRVLTYTSAGHVSGYILDARGAVKYTLASISVPLGIEGFGDFPASPEMPLERGDLLLLLTDGLVEARSPDGIPFGARRLLELTRVYRRHPARQIVDELYHAVRAYSQNHPQDDDITLAVVKMGPLAA
jgi:sigma-B regulation protein RsbU (phosphoserine phosphatase)